MMEIEMLSDGRVVVWVNDWTWQVYRNRAAYEADEAIPPDSTARNTKLAWSVSRRD